MVFDWGNLHSIAQSGEYPPGQIVLDSFFGTDSRVVREVLADLKLVQVDWRDIGNMGNSCRKLDILKCEEKTRGCSALCILYIAHLSILLSVDVCLQLGLCFEQFNLIMLTTLSSLSDDVCLQQGCVVVFQVFGYLSWQQCLFTTLLCFKCFYIVYNVCFKCLTLCGTSATQLAWRLPARKLDKSTTPQNWMKIYKNISTTPPRLDENVK